MLTTTQSPERTTGYEGEANTSSSSSELALRIAEWAERLAAIGCMDRASLERELGSPFQEIEHDEVFHHYECVPPAPFAKIGLRVHSRNPSHGVISVELAEVVDIVDALVIFEEIGEIVRFAVSLPEVSPSTIAYEFELGGALAILEFIRGTRLLHTLTLVWRG